MATLVLQVADLPALGITRDFEPAIAAMGGAGLSPRLRLAMELAVALALVLLDVRDLWFKTRWVGPRDAYAFSSTELLALQPHRLQSSVNFTLPGQNILCISGWTSFLEKCEALSPLQPARGEQHRADFVQEPEVRHVLGHNCRLGPSTKPARVAELVFTSSVRVDSVAWAACSLLFHHRKPPICHSAVVKQFRDRYAMYGSSPKLPNDADDTHQALSPEPGSDAELEIIELLNVISKSTPLQDVVCVEGFANKGPGQYESTIFGCGSPSYYRSAFVGQFATPFQHLMRDKSWLTSDVLHLMQMTLLVRSNSRSTFEISSSDDPNQPMLLKHNLRFNVSCSGALYTLMVLIDIMLMVLNAKSLAEITRWMLLPIWKATARNNLWVKSGSYATKLGFTLQDYNQLLRVSMLRSPPIAALTVVTRILTWAVILPMASVTLDVGKSDQFTVANTVLTLVRLWVLVLLCVNGIWDVLVAHNEHKALQFARSTYVAVFEIASISVLIGYATLCGVLPSHVRAKHSIEHQRLYDAQSFRASTLTANTFPEQLDSLQNTPVNVAMIMYDPLIWATELSVIAVAALAIVRHSYFRVYRQDVMERHQSSLTMSVSSSIVSPDSSSESPSKYSLSGSPSKMSGYFSSKDTTNTTAGILMNSSPSKLSSLGMGGMPPLLKRATSFESVDVNRRLPLEVLLDIPMRARSLVRSSLFMEMNTGHQVTLRPTYYLEFGILLHGSTLRTRCGFLDVVKTLLNVRDHALPPSTDEDVVQFSDSLEKPILTQERIEDVQVPLR